MYVKNAVLNAVHVQSAHSLYCTAQITELNGEVERVKNEQKRWAILSSMHYI